MKKIFLNSCALALMAYGNGLTSLDYLTSDAYKANHLKNVSQTIQDLVDHRKESSEVYIDHMRIEAEDLPVQYLKGLTLKNCVLSRFNLNGVDLSEINLENTRLENCDLENTTVWKGLFYQDVLDLKERAPLELIKIYTDLITKAIKIYKADYTNEYHSKFKEAERFYQTLKAVNCSSLIEDLKNQLDEVPLKTIKFYSNIPSLSPLYKAIQYRIITLEELYYHYFIVELHTKIEKCIIKFLIDKNYLDISKVL